MNFAFNEQQNAIRETVAQSDVRQWATGFLALLGVPSTAA